MTTTLPTRTLGPWHVSAVGLGCMPLSAMSGLDHPILKDRDGAISVIHAALDAGVTLLDTADIYAPSWNTFGHNEKLVGEAFTSWSGSPEAKSKVVITTKNGITRGPAETWGRASNIDYLLRAAVAYALRLGVEKIQLWQHHRLDPRMPFEMQFENVLVLLERGLVERIGVSNYNAEQLRRAIKIGGTPAQGGLVSIQNEYSPRYRREAEVFAICEEFGIAFLPWSPLGGMSLAANLTGEKFRAFTEVGQTHGVSAYAVTIAWHLRNSTKVIPIPGTTKISSLMENLQGASLELTDDEFRLLNASLPEDSPLEGELVDQPVFRD